MLPVLTDFAGNREGAAVPNRTAVGLKGAGALPHPALTRGSNRTTVGLKGRPKGLAKPWETSSNRTTVGLQVEANMGSFGGVISGLGKLPIDSVV